MNRIPRVLLLSLLCTTASLAGDRDSTSLKPLPERSWDRNAAAHLLRRAGFGGTTAEIDKLAALGLEAAVDTLVDYRKTPYEISDPPIDASLHERPDRRAMRAMTEDERRAFFQKRRRLERRAFEETRLWWIDRMVNSPRPFEEKMTLFWHGRFTSGMREVRNAVFMKEQNEFFRRHALDNFRELVLGVSKDRAMLVYLDGNRNVKRKPNENFARELMELFTLGVGNYREADIKAAARAFTGWTFNRDGFTFRRAIHDFGPKQFLGRKGRFNGDDVIDIILAQPACSRFLAGNLLEFFVRPDPPKRLVESLAATIRREEYELKPVMKALFRSRAFYHSDSRGGLVKSPVELLVGTARQLGLTIANLQQAQRAMNGMGQELMQPPNVKGWDGGAAWINTATLYNRYNVVGAMINGGGRGGDGDRRRQRRRAAREQTAGSENAMNMMGGSTASKSRMQGGRQPQFDPLPAIEENRLRTAEQIVDHFARRLLAVPLSSAKRQELTNYLLNGGDKFDLTGRRAAARVRTMIHLLCSTPEYQMY